MAFLSTRAGRKTILTSLLFYVITFLSLSRFLVVMVVRVGHLRFRFVSKVDVGLWGSRAFWFCIEGKWL